MSTRNLDLAQHYLLDLGATMVGPFTLATSPSLDLMAATKAYVDTKVAQGGGGSGTGFPEAPIDGQLYARRGQTSQWLPTAPLDATGRIPLAYLPAAAGNLLYRGGWTVTTNTPVLATGGLVGGVKAARGDYYAALVSGTASPAIDGITTVNAGDWIVSNGTTWERQQNSAGVYLPLTGGTLTGALTAPQLTVNTDIWGVAGLAADLAYSWRDANGNVPVAIAYDGSLMVAAVYPPFTSTMPVSKGYVDGGFLPIANAVAAGTFTVPVSSAFVSPISVDVAFGVSDNFGQMPFMVDTAGNTWIASLRTLSPPNYASATIGQLTYTDLIAANLTAASDWLTGYTYDWTVSDGTHIAAAFTHEGRLRTRLALETQSLDLTTSVGVASAYQLDPCVANVTTCGAGGGIQLKRARGGVWYIQNSHSQSINVWPMAGAQMGSSAIGSPSGVDPGSAIIVWQVSLTKYGVQQAGGGGGGSMVYAGTGFPNPRDARDRAADTVNINDLVGGIDPTGVADNSLQIKAAHDLAYSLGYRYIYFPKGTYNAPFGGATTAPQIGNVIFIGEQASINTYRKNIVDYNARTWRIPNDITPYHSQRLKAAIDAATTGAPANLVILGHSGVNASNFINPQEKWPQIWQNKLSADFANKPIKVWDRSIGGTAWSDIAQNGPPNNHYGNDTGNPVWWATQYENANPGLGYTRRWIEYVLDLQPVAAIWICEGSNDNSKIDVYGMQMVIDEIRARFSPVPEIYIIADYPRNLNSTSSGTKAIQEGTRFAAGLCRTFAKRFGFGYLDIERIVEVYRDGSDPIGGYMTNFIDGFAPPDGHNNQVQVSLPYTYPSETRHFALRMSFGTSTGVFTGGRKLIYKIGNDEENILTFDQDASGFLAYSVQTINRSLYFLNGGADFKGAKGPYMCVPRKVTPFDMRISGGFSIWLDVRDAELWMEIVSSTPPVTQDMFFRERVDRFGGLFQPKVYFDNGTTIAGTTVLQASAFTHNQHVPQMIDYEWLDFTLHPTRFDAGRIWKPLLDAARFV